MPINYFANRDEDSRRPSRINIGDEVLIIEKSNQGTRDVNDLVWGVVVKKLSHGDRYENGAKVQINLCEKDWRYKTMGSVLFTGRVQYIVKKVDEKSGED